MPPASPSLRTASVQPSFSDSNVDPNASTVSPLSQLKEMEVCGRFVSEEAPETVVRAERSI